MTYNIQIMVLTILLMLTFSDWNMEAIEFNWSFFLKLSM